MVHIGDFGKAAGPLTKTAEEIDQLDTASIAGVVVRLNHPHDIPMFAMMEFARMLALGLPAKDMSTQSTLYGVIEASVYTDDFGRFRPAMRSMDDTESVKLVMALYERWSEVPLDISPESSDGASNDPPRQSNSSRRSSKRARQRAKSETSEEIQARLEKQFLGEPEELSSESSM